MLLARIVTVFRQWNYVRLWIDDDRLFPSEDVQWFLCNDSPDSPCPDDLRSRLQARGFTLVEPAFNLGRSAARNRCAALATAPWLEFVDGDDIPLPVDTHWLARAPRDKLLHYPEQSYALIDGRAQTTQRILSDYSLFWKIGFIRRLPILNCRPCALIFPRDAFEQTGGFDGRFDTCEDLHLVWKLDQTPILVLDGPSPKQLYRHDDQTSCDADVVGFHTQRLLRLGRTSDTASRTNELEEVTNAQTLRATRDLLKAFASKASSPGRSALPHATDLADLHWRLRPLYIAEVRPGFTTRLREAIKLLLGR